MACASNACNVRIAKNPTGVLHARGSRFSFAAFVRRSVVEMPRLSRETSKVPADNSHSPFFLLGPTAVGKSRLAVEFAEHVGGEIVGADAFQIYTGLDILSAKPPAELRARVPLSLIHI